jgi:hypothetical protein
MPKKPKRTEVVLDAKTFQAPLDELAVTLAYKVHREGPQYLPKPAFVYADLYMILRQSLETYRLFFYLNADERRLKETGWRIGYSAAILPLIRCMIDCLYNITAILENPGPNGYRFRESGYQQALKSIDADEKQYGGDTRWDAHIAERRAFIDRGMRADGITMADVAAAKLWPTLSSYLRPKKNNIETKHQKFLRTLTYGFWQEYSGLAHATFQGLMGTGFFFTPKDLPHEDRPKLDAAGETMIFVHITRVAAILLCTLTEVQAYFRFDGARINQRLHLMWNALLAVPEIKVLYDERYAALMKSKGINPS